MRFLCSRQWPRPMRRGEVVVEVVVKWFGGEFFGTPGLALGITDDMNVWNLCTKVHGLYESGTRTREEMRLSESESNL